MPLHLIQRFLANNALANSVDFVLSCSRYQDCGPAYPDNIDITVKPLDGGQELVKGQCKRIVFSYTFPKNVKTYVVHSAKVKDAAPGKYVTWCGIYLKKVF